MDSGAPITIAPVLSPEAQLLLGQFFITTTGNGDLSGIVAENSLSRPSNTATQKAAMGASILELKMLGNGFRHVNPNEEVARKVELVTEVNPFQYPQFDKRVTEALEKAAERVSGNALIFYIMITDMTQKTFDDNSTLPKAKFRGFPGALSRNPGTPSLVVPTTVKSSRASHSSF